MHGVGELGVGGAVGEARQLDGAKALALILLALVLGLDVVCAGGRLGGRLDLAGGVIVLLVFVHIAVGPVGALVIAAAGAAVVRFLVVAVGAGRGPLGRRVHAGAAVLGRVCHRGRGRGRRGGLVSRLDGLIVLAKKLLSVS